VFQWRKRRWFMLRTNVPSAGSLHYADRLRVTHTFTHCRRNISADTWRNVTTYDSNLVCRFRVTNDFQNTYWLPIVEVSAPAQPDVSLLPIMHVIISTDFSQALQSYSVIIPRSGHGRFLLLSVPVIIPQSLEHANSDSVNWNDAVTNWACSNIFASLVVNRETRSSLVDVAIDGRDV
jgi:hypothetical protein